ncbi:MAG: putative ribonuclease [Akkermansiaceae bacterium]|nr:putative ribonuclease [Akkermansiaceae bacterium]
MLDSARCMSRFPFSIWCRRVIRRWTAHRHTDNAAALSFYSLISLVPLLLFGVTLASLVFGEKAAHGELDKQLTAVIGDEASKLIDGILKSSRIAPKTQPLAFCTAMVMLLYSGSHVLSKLRESLNQVNGGGLQEPPRSWFGRMVSRALCASLLLMFGVLLVAGTAMEGLASYVQAHVSSDWFISYDLLQGYRWLSTYLLLTLAFFVVLKLLPRHRPNWGHAMIGAAFGAVIVGSLKSILDHFLKYSFWASFVGSGITLLIFFFWLFFSVQAFLIGAEIAAWFGRRQRRRQRSGIDG